MTKLELCLLSGGTEYTHVSTKYQTLNAGLSTQIVTIPILDNMVVAESVLFSVVLTSADPAVVLHPEIADIIIEDDDCELSSCIHGNRWHPT